MGEGGRETSTGVGAGAAVGAAAGGALFLLMGGRPGKTGWTGGVLAAALGAAAGALAGGLIGKGGLPAPAGANHAPRGRRWGRTCCRRGTARFRSASTCAG